jgi:GMP synthase-like glutamine amidotransferase
LEAEFEVKGVILSGGTGNPYEPLNLTSNFVALMNFDVPTIGFCLGYEIIAVTHFARIRKLPAYQNRKEMVTITAPEDPLFAGLTKTEIPLREKHRYHVPKVATPLECIGHSKICPVEIIRHQSKPIYGFQSHPEVSGPDGHRIMCNFLKMCGLPVDETITF